MNITIQNLYYLLSYAWDKLEESAMVDVQKIECNTLVELLAKVLANGCSYVLRRGFDRGYIATIEEGQTVRGKLLIDATLKSTFFNSPRVYCEFDDLSHNVLHNRIIKTTIHRLLNFHQLNDKIHEGLFLIYRRLTEINLIDLETKHFGLVRLHRNNSYYGFLMDICELLHESFFISEEDGSSKFRDFVRDEKRMAVLFEAFVKNFYRQELSGFTVKSKQIDWDAVALDESSATYLPTMLTDIYLESSTHRIIIDTKYYVEALQKHYDHEKIRSSNLYQLNAYLTHLKPAASEQVKTQGILLYPTVLRELDYNYEMKGNKVSIKTINLNQEWRGIHNDLLKIVTMPNLS